MVRVAPLGELKVYMVTEEEIDKLGGGSPGSIFLNFAIALLSLSASFLLTLLTTTIGPSPYWSFSSAPVSFASSPV